MTMSLQKKGENNNKTDLPYKQHMILVQKMSDNNLKSSFLSLRKKSKYNGIQIKMEIYTTAELDDCPSKRLFMSTIQKILEATDNSIKILQNNNMGNYTLIERCSKNTKDPNPLSSTIAQLSTKFPITASKEAITRYRMPQELYPEKSPEDMHLHGRIRCSLKAIDWWLLESPLPTKQKTGG